MEIVSIAFVKLSGYLCLEKTKELKEGRPTAPIFVSHVRPR